MILRCGKLTFKTDLHSILRILKAQGCGRVSRKAEAVTGGDLMGCLPGTVN